MENKYLLSKEKDNQFNHSIKLNNTYFNHNYPKSQIYLVKDKDTFILVMGDFIDAKQPMKSMGEIIESLTKSKEVFDLIEETKYLAGRYLIFTGDSQGVRYVLSDPTVTIPINYSFHEEEVVISSHAKYIADIYGFEQSKDAINIKKAAEQQQPLPYNITMYEEISTLIPNHYLDVHKRQMKRFFPIHFVQQISMDEAVAETIEKTKNIIRGYFNTRKISLPITSGVDSRAVLALMKDYVQELKMYTYYHEEFTEETGDIKIPRELASTFNIEYKTLPIKQMPKKVSEQIASELAGLENHRILNNGYTYSQSGLSRYYPAQGDIISLSKSPFGKKLPESWATLSYFITKTHNYSNEINQYVKKWMDDTEKYVINNNISMYDLYNWEYRLGRWLPNNIKNYDYFIDPIYIFNCRYLTELWVSISKEERTSRSLHLEIIEEEWPELMTIPFNPDDKVMDKLFSNSYMFYFGSFAKYYIKKWI